MTASATSLLIETYSAYPDSPDTPYTASVEAGDFFDTLIDIINPLQHIPVLSNLYREFTGDTISPMARMVGGAVFGGPAGFASATANVLLEQASGGDAMDHAVAFVTGDSLEPTLYAEAERRTTTIQTAENDAPTPDASEIAWSGPRVLPSLARQEMIAPIQMVNKTLPANKAATTNIGPAFVATDTADTSDDAFQLAATGDGEEKPDWMADALLAAKQAQSARANGDEADLPAQPWATNAMMQALEKYEAMTRARNAAATDTAAHQDNRS